MLIRGGNNQSGGVEVFRGSIRPSAAFPPRVARIERGDTHGCSGRMSARADPEEEVFMRPDRSRLHLACLVLAASLWSVQAAAQIGPTMPAGCLQEGVFLYSTEVDFLSRGPVPVDGSPLISDGDLLANVAGTCLICARNQDLLATFGITLELGLDALDVIADGEDVVVAFSTELDAPPQGPGFSAGDLLTRDGAMIPNQTLLQRFSVPYDIGLDAVHGIGEPQDLIAFWNDAAQFERETWLADPELLLDLLDTHDVDLWISTEGTAPTTTAPAFLDGDLLSVRTGNVVARQDQLLPTTVPAGIPTRGVDFGLDAVTGARSDQLSYLELSTEVGHPDAPAFGHSDRLPLGLVWRGPAEEYVACFEPSAFEPGLDAAVNPAPEPGAMHGFAAGLVLLCALGHSRRRLASSVAI